MNQLRAQRRAHLMGFLKQIQKAGVPVENIGDEDGLVASGLIDSLAIMEIVVFLEENYGIDFSRRGIDPEELGSIKGILDLIEREEKTLGSSG
ncbi:MAG: acyl carrier protein [bacterium]